MPGANLLFLGVGWLWPSQRTSLELRRCSRALNTWTYQRRGSDRQKLVGTSRADVFEAGGRENAEAAAWSRHLWTQPCEADTRQDGGLDVQIRSGASEAVLLLG